MSVTDPRLRRGAGLLIAAGVAALLLVGAGRSVAAVSVANCALINVTVNGGTTSAPYTLPAAGGNPTIMTVTARTSNDGIRGIASFAINWVNIAPNTVVWTGTQRGTAVIGGQTAAANTVLANCGVGINVLTDLNGANLNRFKIQNTSGVATAVNIHQVW